MQTGTKEWRRDLPYPSFPIPGKTQSFKVANEASTGEFNSNSIELNGFFHKQCYATV